MDVEQKTLGGESQKLASLLARLEGDQPVSGKELHALWESRARPFWRVQPGIYHALAEKCRRAGENYLAIEAAEEGLTWFGEDEHPAEFHRLFQVRASAYAGVGAREHAREVAARLEGKRAGPAHPSWHEVTGNGAALLTVQAAHEDALARGGCARHAVDAAAAALLLADPAAADLARRARRMCQHEGARVCHDDEFRAAFERVTTMALGALILGEFEAAHEGFRQAGELGLDRRSDLFVIRRQVRLLLGAHRRDPREFDGCLPLPGVALFAGHLFDLPDRVGAPRLPEGNADRLGARIAASLQAHNVLIGYGSAAGGADLLFLREVLARRGGEVHVVLPFARERFRREAVVRHPGHASWGGEFDRIIAAAASVTELGDSPCWFEENASAFCHRVLHGMAERRAREFGDELHTMAVWDGEPTGERAGGTADCVRQWTARGTRRLLLPPDGGEPRLELHREPGLAAAALPVMADVAADADGFTFPVHEDIYAILSGAWAPPGDARGAGERSSLLGMSAFFARAAACLEPFAGHIVHRRVDGPAFRLVFDDLDVAGRAARALCDGAKSGQLRLGLHAGPVMRWPHPFLGSREEPAGIHLQKADRIAAIPWCGQVHASREYVALLEAAPPPQEQERLRCVYQGVVPLGAPFERQELFVVASAAGPIATRAGG